MGDISNSENVRRNMSGNDACNAQLRVYAHIQTPLIEYFNIIEVFKRTKNDKVI